MGSWVAYYDEAIRAPRPANITISGRDRDFLLKDGSVYYYFAMGLPMVADPNVQRLEGKGFTANFTLKETIESAKWLDNNLDVPFQQEGDQVSLVTVPFQYGRHLVVRVAKIVCHE